MNVHAQVQAAIQAGGRAAHRRRAHGWPGQLLRAHRDCRRPAHRSPSTAKRSSAPSRCSSACATSTKPSPSPTTLSSASAPRSGRAATPSSRRFAAALQCGAVFVNAPRRQRSAPALRRRQALRLRPRALRRRHARVPQRQDRRHRRIRRRRPAKPAPRPVEQPARRHPARTPHPFRDVLEDQLTRDQIARLPRRSSRLPLVRPLHAQNEGATRLLAAPSVLRIAVLEGEVRRKRDVPHRVRSAEAGARERSHLAEVCRGQDASRDPYGTSLNSSAPARRGTGCTSAPCWSRGRHQTRRRRHRHGRPATTTATATATTAGPPGPPGHPVRQDHRVHPAIRRRCRAAAGRSRPPSSGQTQTSAKAAG